MNPRSAQPAPPRRLEMGLVFVFGCVALATVLWLAFRAETSQSPVQSSVWAFRKRFGARADCDIAGCRRSAVED